MHIGDGIKLLNLTVSGRQWIANLHHHLPSSLRGEFESDDGSTPLAASTCVSASLLTAARCNLPQRT